MSIKSVDSFCAPLFSYLFDGIFHGIKCWNIQSYSVFYFLCNGVFNSLQWSIIKKFSLCKLFDNESVRICDLIQYIYTSISYYCEYTFYL